PRDLTALARSGELDPVIGRSKEIGMAIEVLARRSKNNPVLIGEPGVGKTAIAEGLAQRIANDDVPEVLAGKRLLELNINAMVAGAKYRGEFEERTKAVIDEIVANKDDVIIFIDEVHTIMGAGQGGGEGGLDMANVMKPAMARGDLNLIAATTLSEYQKHIEKDAALERRFQPVFIAEPSIDQTITILRGLRDKYEAHHKVEISEEAIMAAAELSDRYITNRFLPDKAIDLVDVACARVRISATTRPQEIQELEADIADLTREKEAADRQKNTTKGNEIATRIAEVTEQIAKLETAWNDDKSSDTPCVRMHHVAEVVSNLTGVPVSELTAEEREKLLKLEDQLHERVIGQEEAVEAVSLAVRLARSGLQRGNKPVATFLFLGPTGVGKTELAKALAGTVYGDEDAMVRLDMSEYMERHAVARLIGAPPGYVGYEEGGQLTERVRRRPHTVILLDEIEKAHPDAHNILLQLFDDGRLTDGKGRVVDFTNAIIIATSNVGAHLIQDNLTKDETERSDYEGLKEKLMSELGHRFRPEFLNRLDEIIVFHALTKSQIRQIVELQLQHVIRTAHGQGIELSLTDATIDYLADIGYRPEFGARELKRQIRTKVEGGLATLLLEKDYPRGAAIKAGFDEKTSKITFEATEPTGTVTAEVDDRKSNAA
ncbi:MAG: ATP-dependent Clp protease ATP-binding subunit ClpC, partial [Hyphomicrobiaceae bacterium]